MRIALTPISNKTLEYYVSKSSRKRFKRRCADRPTPARKIEKCENDTNKPDKSDVNTDLLTMKHTGPPNIKPFSAPIQNEANINRNHSNNTNHTSEKRAQTAFLAKKSLNMTMMDRLDRLVARMDSWEGRPRR